MDPLYITVINIVHALLYGFSKEQLIIFQYIHLTGLFDNNTMTATFQRSLKFQECPRKAGKRSNLSIHLTDKY